MSDPGDKTCEITQSGENKHGIIKWENWQSFLNTIKQTNIMLKV